MGMIVSTSYEDPVYIKKYITSLSIPENFGSYQAYSFVVPDKFAAICPMLDIKKSELFGPKLSLRAFSEGHARHAKFVIRAPEELVISIGKKNTIFGESRSR